STILPSFMADVPDWPHIKNLRLADQGFLTPRPIDVIIGADFYGEEEPPSVSDSALIPEEEECEAHFWSTHYREQTGRYVVRIPLIEPATLFGNSYKTVQMCLHRTLQRFKKNPDYQQLYSNFMREYEDLGHMVRVTAHLEDQHQAIDSVEPEGGMTLAHDASASGGLRVSSEGSTAQSRAHFHPFYLSHHGVLKEGSATTKLRVVFNVSKVITSGRSVNDLMHTGANLLLNVCDVLIWIRHYHHLFATDITKMYRQIALHRDDWDLQRILWVDEQHKVVPYHLTTVTYGMKAAPFLATRTLQQLVQDESHRFPLAVPCLTHGRYVDDIFGGVDSVDELINVANQLIGLCHAGGFPLAKWHATHPEVLKAVTSDMQQSAIISFDDDATKLFGIQWLPQTARFGFTTKIADQPNKLTKRRILSDVARILDPLGFASPVIVRAKMLLQEL
ncbi:uncharacterized protein LOC128896649, partial [Hylaeus anthracinus]|uniref:uncharacterized protein LOC128896649 n=1 Tax=Hylaeus anthracinus TaxID=313031 RepID=UPI0023B93830